MIRTPVTSSWILSVGHDGSTLEVEFVTGSIYQYADVPACLANALLRATSPSRFFDQAIRDQFASQEIKDLPGQAGSLTNVDQRIALDILDDRAFQGLTLHLFKGGPDDWEVWLNLTGQDFEGLCVACGATRDAAIAVALRVFEMCSEHLRQRSDAVQMPTEHGCGPLTPLA